MGLVLRALLIWLLVLAVPAQGLAAATMAFCGANHHGGGAAATAQSAVSDEAAHHDMAAPAEPGEPGPVLLPASTESGHHGEGSKKCSACASCCSIGAMLSPALAVPVAVVAPTVFSVVVATIDPFAANGPDRPPRIGLA